MILPISPTVLSMLYACAIPTFQMFLFESPHTLNGHVGLLWPYFPIRKKWGRSRSRDKALAAKQGSLSSNPKTNKVEGEN